MAKQEQATAEIKYDISQLRSNCKQLFKVDQIVFDGAMCGIKGKITKKEAKEKISSWLEKEVK